MNRLIKIVLFTICFSIFISGSSYALSNRLRRVVLSGYYWKENTNFGKDMVMSRNHKVLESNLAERFGPYLKYVKIQPNK